MTAPRLTFMKRQAEIMRRRAFATPPYTGHATAQNAAIVQRCRATYPALPTTTSLIFTRDDGMHDSGWWKNPDYARCLHLSLCFIDTKSGERAPQDHKLAKTWCELFFGPMVRLLWIEPPYSPEGRVHDVWHYRVFMHEDWRTPLLMRGEVYTREFTAAGWKSWSDLHGEEPETAHR